MGRWLAWPLPRHQQKSSYATAVRGVIKVLWHLCIDIPDTAQAHVQVKLIGASPTLARECQLDLPFWSYVATFNVITEIKLWIQYKQEHT